MSIKDLIKSAFGVVRPIVKLLLLVFFKRKYLRGRYFDGGYVGYVWSFRSILHRNILRLGDPLPWPAGFNFKISNPQNITFHPDDLNNFQSAGVYFQNFKAHIYLGQGTYIAPNVGIITANHDLYSLDDHAEGKDVVIGNKCWIGMNSVILPGVTLGERTVVAAGSVVTSSFPDGKVVIGGVPAKILKVI